MNIHSDLIAALMEAIKESEKVNGALTFSKNRNILNAQFKNNEFYYCDKLVNNNLSRYEYYKKSLVEQEPSFYNRLFEMANEFCEMQEFDLPLIKEYVKLYQVTQMDLSYIAGSSKATFNHLLYAIALFRQSYISFPVINHKTEFATIVMNSYLKKNDYCNFSILLSEVIFNNYSIFQSAIVEKERFNVIFLKLIIVEMKKISSRFVQVEKLMEFNHEKFVSYGIKIENYISREMIFTITDFVGQNDISYNTGKKYLKELVDAGILENVKIAKHNGYVYRGMLSIWMK